MGAGVAEGEGEGVGDGDGKGDGLEERDGVGEYEGGAEEDSVPVTVDVGDTVNEDGGTSDSVVVSWSAARSLAGSCWPGPTPPVLPQQPQQPDLEPDWEDTMTAARGRPNAEAIETTTSSLEN